MTTSFPVSESTFLLFLNESLITIFMPSLVLIKLCRTDSFSGAVSKFPFSISDKSFILFST